MTLKRLHEKLPVILVALAWLSLLPGQFFRWQPSSGSTAGLLFSDAVAFFGFLGAVYFFFKEKSVRSDRAVRLLLVWIGVLILSWIVASFRYSTGEILFAAGYLIRLITYLGVFLVAMRATKDMRQAFIRYAILTTIVLFLFGLLIMWQLPDFAPLAVLGWDPHVGRLTSTWLDPNFLGSFIALVFAGALCFEADLFGRNKKQWWLLLGFLAICWLSLYLTISRSAMVTLAVAGLVAGIRTSWRAVGITVAAILLLLLVPSRLQDRLVSSVAFIGGSTAGSTTGTTGTSVDPSANARVESWKRAWNLTKTDPVLGVGYNYFEQASIHENLLPKEGETRGTAGSDSSLLTLLATTGWIGLLAVLAFFAYLAHGFLTHRGVWSSIGLTSVVGMAVGSQFNNFLLYPLALLPLMLLLGIAYQDIQKS